LKKLALHLRNDKSLSVSSIQTASKFLVHKRSIYSTASLSTAEIYAIDPTGAQFGHTLPVMPWREYVQKRVGCITRETGFGVMTQMLKNPTIFLPTLESQELSKAFASQITDWAEVYGGKLSGVLVGTESAFEIAMYALVDKVEQHFKGYLATMYTPEKCFMRGIAIARVKESALTNPSANGDLNLKALKYIVDEMEEKIGSDNTEIDSHLHAIACLYNQV
jgi:hypothetical protein